LLSTSSVFFNKSLMEDYGLDLPYEQVQSGEWYLEDMFTSIEDFHEEGDMGIEGKTEDDIFGIVIPSQLYCWPESFGIELVQKDADTGELVLNGHDERMYDLVEKMYKILWESDGGYVITRPSAQAMFGQNQAVYIPVHIGSAVQVFLDYDVDYGIVPYPKLDESQEEYYAGYTDRYFVIPHTCTDPDYVGTILESMSAEGYRQVTPAYFEVALKNRYTKDAVSKEMVDLIRQSMILDFAYVYGGNRWWTDTMRDLLTYMPALDSVSIVPAGLTRYRQKLYPLEPYTPTECRGIIAQVSAVGDRCVAEYGRRVFFCADEMYIKGGLPLPEDEYYEDYSQLEDGIGMVTSLSHEFHFEMQFLEDDLADYQGPRRVTAVTGVAASESIRTLCAELEAAVEDLTIQVVPVVNHFFGETITVAGLLTGHDMAEQLAGLDLGDEVLIPANTLRADGDLFLCGMTPMELSRKLGVPVRVCPNDGVGFLTAMLGVNTDTPRYDASLEE
jgi:hypothetical protein